jgi:hypothetical protein
MNMLVLTFKVGPLRLINAHTGVPFYCVIVIWVVTSGTPDPSAEKSSWHAFNYNVIYIVALTSSPPRTCSNCKSRLGDNGTDGWDLLVGDEMRRSIDINASSRTCNIDLRS